VRWPSSSATPEIVSRMEFSLQRASKIVEGKAGAGKRGSIGKLLACPFHGPVGRMSDLALLCSSSEMLEVTLTLNEKVEPSGNRSRVKVEADEGRIFVKTGPKTHICNSILSCDSLTWNSPLHAFPSSLDLQYVTFQDLASKPRSPALPWGHNFRLSWRPNVKGFFLINFNSGSRGASTGKGCQINNVIWQLSYKLASLQTLISCKFEDSPGISGQENQ